MATPPTIEQLEEAAALLCVFGRTLVREDPEAFWGIAADDLINDTLLRFFQSPSRLGWDGKRPLGNFLCGVLKNVSFEARRRLRRMPSVPLQDVPGEKLPQTQPRSVSSPKALIDVDHVRAIVAGDETLKDLVEAVLAVEDTGRKINQALAKKTGKPIKAIENGKKRLKRKILNSIGEQPLRGKGRKKR